MFRQPWLVAGATLAAGVATFVYIFRGRMARVRALLLTSKDRAWDVQCLEGVPVHLTTEDTLKHLHRLRETCTDAFQDDPYFSYMEPNAARRRKSCLNPIFTSFLLEASEGVRTLTAADSVGIWIKGGHKPSKMEQMANGGLVMCWLSSWSAIAKGMSYADWIQGEMKRARATHPNLIYLKVLCTRRRAQGKGHGSTMLRQLCREADAEELPCYLDTANPTAKALYERFGFVEIGKFEHRPGAPPGWLMTRPPHAPEKSKSR
mmetsp:Transcript_25253/g.59560  ORF Transcript_25253/g.59560 Transcript_25253/m.59560 type:complete len:262 (+) Transcript_25253:23-808(+)